MDTINILLIEDNQEESDLLAAILKANDYNVVGIASTYKEALVLFYNNSVDVIIIDIYLQGKPDGVAFAETISIVPDALRPFVFLTSSKDREIFDRAKLTKPFSFLIKPYNELELLYALEMAVEKFYEQQNVLTGKTQNAVVSDKYLFIKKNKALKKVRTEDISYVEVEDRYCNIITENEKFVILISLTKILEVLDPVKFIRTHRNYIVNSNKIIEIVLSDNLVILQGNYNVTLSEKYKDLVSKFKILK
ncbi:LytR/AlgR family response regulator transcription factor [Flavobacterium reichenbachii]|uniref:LytTR family transcriptional regulator n=1 Tax=Flavobacterium reichenbachii TaxID=362418 RepID=A0A085ZL23_9FLAO|nr:response regulator transcription factor [Flavobacterium reichenbachii]KFF05137.1 LytTR family transcriptional regulator [Flavobacterium reichenbachii]OXB16194.1 DNA-binding response regulator [Flavobacterium reichenbachii]